MAAAAVLVPALASAQTVVTDPHLQATTQQILTADVVLLLGWRIVPAIAGTAVVNERF
jgi:hypothetical protein